MSAKPVQIIMPVSYALFGDKGGAEMRKLVQSAKEDWAAAVERGEREGGPDDTFEVWLGLQEDREYREHRVPLTSPPEPKGHQ